jgi:hypothetical protein
MAKNRHDLFRSMFSLSGDPAGEHHPTLRGSTPSPPRIT